MNIFIDETGSFVSATERSMWNCVVAYMSPETEEKQLARALRKLKENSGFSVGNEIKLKNVDEKAYIKFLESIGSLNGVVFSTAIDCGAHNESDVISHQLKQAEKIVEHKSKLIHEAAQRGLQELADKVSGFSPQLYTQLHCQIQLVAQLIRYGILYFVQRVPRTLGKFSWRVDEKNSTKPVFEETLHTLLPPIMQSKSLEEKFICLRGADYSKFNRFLYEEGKAPTYLEDTYGIPRSNDLTPINIGKLVREDFQFVNSEAVPGVQVADLLASGLRRCLRNGFSNNEVIAKLIGRLTIQGLKGSTSLLLMTLGEESIDDTSANIVNMINKNNRPLVLPSRQKLHRRL